MVYLRFTPFRGRLSAYFSLAGRFPVGAGFLREMSAFSRSLCRLSAESVRFVIELICAIVSALVVFFDIS